MKITYKDFTKFIPLVNPKKKAGKSRRFFLNGENINHHKRYPLVI